MARKERLSKGRTMKPNYFVFCEGDTEVLYVELLRSYYRLPIHIIAKRTLLNITPALVKRCKDAYIQTDNDHTYLMYDLDVPSMKNRLLQIPDATLICSNPCLELWFLLHYIDQKSELSSQECVLRLQPFFKQYKKGALSPAHHHSLLQNMMQAVERAKKLNYYNNPSSTIFRLIDDLERLK